MQTLNEIVQAVVLELTTASDKFGAFNSTHEGYAVIKEEVDELWDDIKHNKINDSRKEAVQVAAMAMRYILDIKERK